MTEVFFDEHIKNKITVSVNNIDDESSKSIMSLEARNKSNEYDTPIHYISDLCIFKEVNLFADFYVFEHEFIYEKELLDISDDDLRQKLFGSSFALFGGLGFSGYAGEHSATSGIYGSAIKSLDADLKETRKFEALYNKLYNSCPKNRIIIATHTPKEYWSKRGYNSNWIYINGHTHNNFYEISDRCTVYADNQIGYTPCPINAKHFY